MYENAVSEGPVFISNRSKPAYVIQTIENYEEQIISAPKEKSLFEVAAELRKEYGIEDDDDFDLSEHLEKLKKKSVWFRKEKRDI